MEIEEQEHHEQGQVIRELNVVLKDIELNGRTTELMEELASSVLNKSKELTHDKNGKALVDLMRSMFHYFGDTPKAKTAKIIRSIIDALGDIPGFLSEQTDLCSECVEWCRKERRTFLRQRIQTKLCSLLVQRGSYSQALELTAELQLEMKKLDDKIVLVEIFLIESHAYLALSNRNKAKSSLTAARANATSTYVGPLLQAEIDLQGGILNADDKDYRTAFSYLLESFEGFHPLGDKRALQALRYMITAKIMHGQGDEVPTILSSKNASKYVGPETDALRGVAKAYKERSLKDFDHVIASYTKELQQDDFIKRHLEALHATLLEKNLSKIIEPFSRVEIAHVAKLIDLPVKRVETTISAMILDKKFHGILDQGEGILIVFDDPPVDTTYQASLDLIQSLGDVVDSLVRRASTLA